MLALARKRRTAPAARIEPPPVAEMEDTPVTVALREIVRIAQRDGIHGAAATLTADNALLRDLTRAVLDQEISTAQALWLNSQECVRGAHDRYGEAMGAMGLAWMAYPEEFLHHQGRPNFPSMRLRKTYAYHQPSKRELPAVVVPVLNNMAQLTAVVLLFVASDWSGWAEANSRVTVVGRAEGCVVPMRAITRNHLTICGTFETLSKGGELSRGAWITVTAENLARHFVPPETLQSLWILHDDHDRDAAIAGGARIAGLNEYIRISLVDVATQEATKFEGY